jgi:hypothetical protein
MANSLIVTGALIRVYLNNKVYSVAQSVSLEYDAGEYEIRGINSPYAQEIAGGGAISAKGSIKGIRVKNSGGIQGSNGRPLFSDVAASSYISIRIEDRSTGETIWSAPKSKITRVSETTQIKGVYFLSIDFVAQILYWPLDLS